MSRRQRPLSEAERMLKPALPLMSERAAYLLGWHGVARLSILYSERSAGLPRDAPRSQIANDLAALEELARHRYFSLPRGK